MQTSEKHDRPIKLSLIELGAVNEGRNRSESIKDIIETAQKIEEWGFSRYWLAEHHNLRTLSVVLRR